MGFDKDSDTIIVRSENIKNDSSFEEIEDNKLISSRTNLIGFGSGDIGWNFVDETSYVAYLLVNGTFLPVTKFFLESSISSYFFIEVFVLSKHKLDAKVLYKRNCSLKCFHNSLEQSYSKVIEAKIYEIYYQGLSYLLKTEQYNSKAPEFFLYKIVLYPDLYQLTFKSRNYIYKNESDPDKKIRRVDVVEKIYKEDYKLSLSISVIKEEMEEVACVTQYQESDYLFALRLIEESGLLLYYDFSSNIPKLCISMDLGNFSVSFHKLSRPYNVKETYQFEEIEEISVCADGSFSAIIYSFHIFAGSVFIIDDDLRNKYFVRESKISLEYIGGVWVFINKVIGFLMPVKSLLVRKTNPLIMSGAIEGMVVSNKKNSFHVDQNGRIQVRYLWDTKVIDREVVPESKEINYLKEDEAKLKKDEGVLKEEVEDSSFIKKEENKIEALEEWNLGYEKTNVSTWIPVSQWGAAGSEYGNYNFPRAGQHVLVFFLQGKIDEPVVVGTIFNNTNVFPNVRSFNIEQELKSEIEEDGKNLVNEIEEAKDVIDLKEIPPDHSIIPPKLSKAAGNIVFKHFSYNKSNETVVNGFNEISMENNSGKEKVHLLSSNLVNIRSKKDMHNQVNDSFIGIYGAQRETILNNRDTYIFGEDNYTVLNSKRMSFFLNYTSESNKVEQAVMNAFQMAKVKAAEAIISHFISGTYDLAIYDHAMKANVLFHGNYVTAALHGNVGFILPIGTFSVVTNFVTLSAAGSYTEIIGGYRTTTIAGYYSMNVLGKLLIDSSNFAIDVGKWSVVSGDTSFEFADFNLKALDTSIEFAKFSVKAAESSIEFADCDIKMGKLGIEAGEGSMKFANLSIECAEFSLKCAAPVQIDTTVFEISAAASVQLKAPTIMLG